MTLLRLLPLTKSFPARFRNPKLPSRPGWAVSFDLLLWMGLLGVGIYDMVFVPTYGTIMRGPNANSST